jgi:hypothetical protein
MLADPWFYDENALADADSRTLNYARAEYDSVLQLCRKLELLEEGLGKKANEPNWQNTFLANFGAMARDSSLVKPDTARSVTADFEVLLDQIEELHSMLTTWADHLDTQIYVADLT